MTLPSSKPAFAIAYVLPAHRMHDERAFHSNYADGGPIPIVLSAVVLALALALRRRGSGAGIVLGLATAACSFAMLVHMFFTSHAFGDRSPSDRIYGDLLTSATFLALLVTGAAVLVLGAIGLAVPRHRRQLNAFHGKSRTAHG